MHKELYAPSTTNSETWFVCKENMYCKRIWCDRCKNIRREYWIESGTIHCSDRGKLAHVVIPWGEGARNWNTLAGSHQVLRDRLPRRHWSFFMYCHGMGKKEDHPHTHYILKESSSEALLQYASKFGAKFARKHITSIYQVPELLGYLYDKNVVPSLMAKTRPKGMNTIGGTRGISYGFPKLWQIEAIKRGEI